MLTAGIDIGVEKGGKMNEGEIINIKSLEKYSPFLSILSSVMSFLLLRLVFVQYNNGFLAAYDLPYIFSGEYGFIFSPYDSIVLLLFLSMYLFLLVVFLRNVSILSALENRRYLLYWVAFVLLFAFTILFFTDHFKIRLSVAYITLWGLIAIGLGTCAFAIVGTKRVKALKERPLIFVCGLAFTLFWFSLLLFTAGNTKAVNQNVYDVAMHNEQLHAIVYMGKDYYILQRLSQTEEESWVLDVSKYTVVDISSVEVHSRCYFSSLHLTREEALQVTEIVGQPDE